MSVIEKVGAQPDERPGPRGAKPGTPRKRGVPAGAKKPADHQPAKNDVITPGPRTITWNTKAGAPLKDGRPGKRVPATYTIDPLIFDDIEFVEMMITMEEAATPADKTITAYKAVKILLGPEQFDQYKENERDPDTGRTSFSGTIEFFHHIQQELSQGNS